MAPRTQGAAARKEYHSKEYQAERAEVIGDGEACATEGCHGRAPVGRLCRPCYMAERAKRMPTCSLCESPSHSKGLCNRHYLIMRAEAMPPCQCGHACRDCGTKVTPGYRRCRPCYLRRCADFRARRQWRDADVERLLGLDELEGMDP